MKRTKSYDEELSDKLRDPEFAQNYILALMEGEEGLSAQEALRHTIRRMGIKEFAQMAGLPPSNVSEFLAGKRAPKLQTLDSFLEPFHLKTKLVLEKAA